ncbi:putative nuclease HARBI1 [Mercenaria mercenaria]|uniref:putative nuclease HARBI1 n=1 Tax=Mercenaria mercenaria TaxID=6596 RepID=UPI00234FA25F|nr:putative nuclease HARBI1 [Mercenaria mercenaria]
MAEVEMIGALLELSTASTTSEDHIATIDLILSRAKSKTFLINSIASASSMMREQKFRVMDYVDVVLPCYSIDDFKDRFRISRETFDKLVMYMNPHMIRICPHQKISTEKKLLVFIKYVATQLYYQAIADMFGICETTVHNIVHDVSKLISSHLLNTLVKWPSGRSLKNIENGFKEMQGFPGVIGAIDASHIPIRTPIEYPENYFNRKSFPSVILQAVCDNNMMFTDVYCGWPGSVHDARVLRNSSLFEKAEVNADDTFPHDTHLIGDAAYPIASWLLVPFKDHGNLNKAQKVYNFKHSSTRMVIERAFGALKGRFRRLKYVEIYDLQTCVHIILSCCAIHQLCLATFEDLQEYIEEGMAEMEDVNCWEDITRKSKSGLNKRNAIVDLFQ